MFVTVKYKKQGGNKLKKALSIALILSMALVLLTGCGNKGYNELKEAFETDGVTVTSYDDLKKIEGEMVPVLLKGKVTSDVSIVTPFVKSTYAKDYLFMEIKYEKLEQTSKKVKDTAKSTSSKTVYKTVYTDTWKLKDTDTFKPNTINVAGYDISWTDKYFNKQVSAGKMHTTELNRVVEKAYKSDVKNDYIMPSSGTRYSIRAIEIGDAQGILGWVTNGEFVKNDNYDIYLVN